MMRWLYKLIDWFYRLTSVLLGSGMLLIDSTASEDTFGTKQPSFDVIKTKTCWGDLTEYRPK